MPRDSKVEDDSDGSKSPAADSHRTDGPHEPDAGSRGPATGNAPRRWRLLVRALKVLVAVVVSWLILAYLILPALWRHYEHQPALESAPKTTVTAQGIPGDALNVGLIGTEQEIVSALLGSGWDAADPVTLRSSIGIARSVLRDKPYIDAPVSPLFVFGRSKTSPSRNRSARTPATATTSGSGSPRSLVEADCPSGSVR
jgi:hypothetical protein